MLLQESFKSIGHLVYNNEIGYNIETIDIALSAIDEGFTNIQYIQIGSDSMKELVLNMIKAIFDHLLETWDRISHILSSYIVNTITALKKIRNIVVSMDASEYENIVIKTYEYPKLYELPEQHKKVLNTNLWTGLIRDIKKEPHKINQMEIRANVDKNINSFASRVLGTDIRVAGNVRNFTYENCERLMRGRELEYRLNKEKALEIIDQLLDYKMIKNEIMETKKDINEYYSIMKKEMISYFDMSDTNVMKFIDTNGDIETISMPVLSSVKIEANRLMTAYIDIYNISFTYKLKCFNDIMETNKNTIMTILRSNYVKNTISNRIPQESIIT